MLELLNQLDGFQPNMQVKVLLSSLNCFLNQLYLRYPRDLVPKENWLFHYAMRRPYIVSLADVTQSAGRAVTYWSG